MTPMDMRVMVEQRNDLLDQMDELVKFAETRALSDEEESKFKSLEMRVKSINAELSSYEESRKFGNEITNAGTGKKTVIKKEREREEMGTEREERALKNVIMPGEKFKIETRGIEKGKEVNFGNLVRGMAGLGWGNDEETRAYYRSMQSGNNKVVIPTTLAEKIIDYTRNKSAILHTLPIASMEHNNLSIAVQTKDVEAHFVEEGQLIPESEATFKGVTLEGKTLAMFVPISEQLLSSAQNLEAQLISSCSQALSVALDKAILYGTGVGAEIKGLTTYAGINTVTYDPADLATETYNIIIKGARDIKMANLSPTNFALNVGLASELASSKSADGFYLEMPRNLSQYEQAESNNLKANEGIVYDRDQLLLGIHKNITVEWGHSEDQFRRIMKGLRIVMRCDLGVLNEKAISHIKPQ